MTRKNLLRRQRITENKAWVRAYKLEHGPCSHCGGQFHPQVMQFHHIMFPKVGNVSDLVCDGYSLDTIKAEIEKCELICANCHALRTALSRETA